MRFCRGAGDGAGAQQARVVRRAQSIRSEVSEINYSNIHYVNLRAEMARGNIGIGQMANALHISRDTMARKLAGRSPLHLDEAFRLRDRFFPACSVEALFREEREERGA